MNAADHAQDITELFLERAEKERRQQQEIREGRVLETAKECFRCGGMIPSARQAALPGVQTCVRCAEELEALAMRGSGMVKVA